MFLDRAGDWAKIGEKTKTIFCIKGHRFGAMNHPEQVRWLHDQIKSDWLKVCFDWSHFELREIKMAEAIKELIPVTKFVHVKDAIAVPGQADRPKFGIPGAGTTDYAKLLPALIAAGYRGSVMIEISGMLWAEKDYDPFALAKKGYDCLTKVPGVF
jgi:inosose dehydratase